MAKRDKKRTKGADAAGQGPAVPRGGGAGRSRDAGGATRAGRGEEAGTVASTTTNLPMWIPSLTFVALAVVLFRDFIFSDQMLFGNDTLGLGYVARAFYADALSTLGRVPGWAPQLLGGTPFLEALASGDSLYPPSVLLLMLMEPYRALGWKLVLHVALAGFFMFGWVRAIGASRAAAFLGATAYMLAPYFVSLVMPGHDGKLFVTALAPLLFWAVERHFEGPQPRTVASIALVIGLIILTTHFQMAYFLFGAVGMYAIYRSVDMWRGREVAGDGPTPARSRRAMSTFGLFLAASILGAGVAAVQLLPAVDYVTEYSRRVQTTREAAGESGVAWSSSWSLHPEEVVAMVIPEFAGNNSRGADWSQNTYWGRNQTKDNHEGAGLVILLLAAVSFVGGARRGLRFFFAGLGAVALLFALGLHTPLWGFFYAVVPGVSLFRAPSQIMFLFAFSASTLGALGLDRMLELSRTGDDTDSAKVTKVLTVALAALGLLALLAGSGVLTSIWTSAVYPEAAGGRLERLAVLQPFIARGAGIAFLLSALTAGVAWAARAGYLAPAGIVAVMVTLVAVDELRISSGFIEVFDFQAWSTPDGFTRAVLERETGSDEPYRLLSFRRLGQDVQPALHGIELAAGHHPNDLSRYRELIGMVGSGLPDNLLNDIDIRRLLNVRYVLWPDYQFGGAFGPPASVIARSQLQSGEPYESMHIEGDLPRARLVGSAVVKSDAEAVEYMLSDAFDPETTVVLAEPSPLVLDGSLPSAGTVTWTERTPDRLALSVTTERPALLVVADNWFPAWRATVDGAETPVLRAYHTLRAVPVPAGQHTVEMEYHSTIVARSMLVSLLLTLALAGVIVGQFLFERRKRRAP